MSDMAVLWYARVMIKWEVRYDIVELPNGDGFTVKRTDGRTWWSEIYRSNSFEPVLSEL